MKLCKALLSIQLLLVTGYSAPVVAQVSFSVTGAACRYRCWMDGWQHSVYEARRETALTYDHCTLNANSTVCLTQYGAVNSDAAGWTAWSAEYTTEVGVVARWTHGMYVGAECWVFGRPRSDLYSDAMPGMRWLSAGIASTFNATSLMYWQPGEWNPPPPSSGCEGAGNLDSGELTIPMSNSIDYIFYWWRNHGSGNPGFAPFMLELGVDPAYSHGRCEVVLNTRSQSIPYQPPTWTVCRERADFTITIPTIEAVVARECADLNADGTVNVQDVFMFLAYWFSVDSRADWDRDAACLIEDIQVYLSNWFRSI